MREDIVGKKFGELLVIGKETRRTKSGHPKAFLTVKCSCGRVYQLERGNVVHRGTKRCKACAILAVNPRHFEANTKHELYAAWVGMMQRCLNPKSGSYDRYGGRGISVCDRWRGERKQGQITGSIDGFHNFLLDMGPRPSPEHSIDRIDPHGNYEPANCRWATPEVQQANKRDRNEWKKPNKKRFYPPSESQIKALLREAKVKFARQVKARQAEAFFEELGRKIDAVVESIYN